MSITRMRENRARWLHWVLVAPVALLLVLGASPARAAAPQCAASSVRIDVPAGGTVALPTASCSDADGDPIAIEITRPPAAGTLDPATPAAQPGGRRYTAGAGAAGTTDTVGFRAVAAGETSGEVTVELVVGAANRVPVCDDVTVAVRAGGSARVPFTRCVDADGDYFNVVIEQEPASGRFDYGAQTYTPAAGFAGEDVMTFRAVDVWLGRSALGTVRLVVGDGDGVEAGGGGTAPTGSLPPGSFGGGAGTVLPPDAAQAGSGAFTLRAPSRQRLATARRRGVRFRAEAAEPGRLAVRVLVGRKLARRLKLGRKASGAVKIGRSKVRLRQGTSSHRIKLSRKARARLKRVKPPRVRLRASFRTADGEVHVQTRRVRLTRGRR